MLLLQCRQQPLLRTVSVRSFSYSAIPAETRTSSTQEDLVKATIQKMMQHESPANATKEALHKASYSLKKKLDEVKACLTDVMEEEDKEAELETTDMALEEAAAAYIDLLDLVREADETTAVQYKEVRESSAAQIREYRQELDQHRQTVSA
eukprot:scaffold1663_cov171-Amphora_coffeaeformis.AAC.14